MEFEVLPPLKANVVDISDRQVLAWKEAGVISTESALILLGILPPEISPGVKAMFGHSVGVMVGSWDVAVDCEDAQIIEMAGKPFYFPVEKPKMLALMPPPG